MVTDEEIKKLAWSIWQAEGRPEGKHLNHYFRAKQILEQREEVQAHTNKLWPHPASWPVGAPPSRKDRLW